MAKVLLVTHRQTQHIVVNGGLGSEGGKAGGGNEGDDPRTYGLAFTARAGPRPFPVEWCSGRVSTQTEMVIQYWHRHVRDTMVILEKVKLPHPR